jgi:hypothetical protein
MKSEDKFLVEGFHLGGWVRLAGFLTRDVAESYANACKKNYAILKDKEIRVRAIK